MALEQFDLDGQVTIFHVDGGIEGNKSPLPIPDC